MLDTLKGRRQLRQLWIEQEGLCPVCQQKITELTGWHNHHIVWRSYGGTDTNANRVLLYPYLPSTSSCTRTIRCETAFGNERLKGLSGMIGNFHVPFLVGLEEKCLSATR